MSTPDLPLDEDEGTPLEGALFERATYGLFRHQHELTTEEDLPA